MSWHDTAPGDIIGVHVGELHQGRDTFLCERDCPFLTPGSPVHRSSQDPNAFIYST